MIMINRLNGMRSWIDVFLYDLIVESKAATLVCRKKYKMTHPISILRAYAGESWGCCSIKGATNGKKVLFSRAYRHLSIAPL